MTGDRDRGPERDDTPDDPSVEDRLEPDASVPARSARARIRTEHADPAVAEERVDAETVAAALSPDNTDEMTTTVVDGGVETTIRREGATGLGSTADDYLVNLDVAVRVAQHANRHQDTTTDT